MGEALPGDNMGDDLGAQGATASRFPGISTRMSVGGCADSFLLPISCIGITLHLDGRIMQHGDRDAPLEPDVATLVLERQAEAVEQAASKRCFL